MYECLICYLASQKEHIVFSQSCKHSNERWYCFHIIDSKITHSSQFYKKARASKMHRKMIEHSLLSLLLHYKSRLSYNPSLSIAIAMSALNLYLKENYEATPLRGSSQN